MQAKFTETLIQAFISCRLDYCNSLVNSASPKVTGTILQLHVRSCGTAFQLICHKLTF